jgi:hypothetical protein
MCIPMSYTGSAPASAQHQFTRGAGGSLVFEPLWLLCAGNVSVGIFHGHGNLANCTEAAVASGGFEVGFCQRR